MTEQKTTNTRKEAERSLWAIYKKFCLIPLSEVISFADYGKMLKLYESALRVAEERGVDTETLEYHRNVISECKPGLTKPRNLEAVTVEA